MEMKIEVTKLDKDDIVNILSTALSGGISYWARELSFNDDLYAKVKEYEDTYEDTLAEMLITYPSTAKITIKPYDEKTVYELTEANLKEGIAIAWNKSYINTDIKYCDAEEADIIIQCSLFKELIYG